MAITPGTKIGAYEVTSQLGEGGMGVVFRAKDTKLLRDVALKVLPDDLANDPDRLSRLQREAQLLASLNHPNIAQIYGLEQVGSSGCIVMELVEGETLSEKLLSGPIPIDEAIEIAKQIADALAAAHERGIVHRDLKPANIKLTPNGTVKVLDFGLAKALSNRAMETAMSTLPTMLSGSTAGMIVGTAAYMSPEQARGKEVDARTDVWAFGCVLYQMLTARLAFDGETATDMIAKIVTAPPDLSLLPPETPLAIRLLLEATLNKNVQQRLQHIGDMRLFLDQKFFPSTPAGAAPAAAQPASKRSKWIAIAAQAVTLLALVAAVVYFRSIPPPASPLMQLEVPLPGVVGLVSVSPDGQKVAYYGQASSAENRSLWIRQVGNETPQKLPAENVNGGAIWSPDSRYIAFISEGKLKKIDVLGGKPQVLCDFVGPGRGFAWSPSGIILFTRANGIVQVSENGGEIKSVSEPDPKKQEIFHGGPVALPDGKHYLFLIVSSVADNSGFFAGTLGSKDFKRLLPMPSGVNGFAYASGFVMYTNASVLYALPFNTKSLTIEAQQTAVADGVEGGLFSVSDTGLLVYRKGTTGPPNRQLTWYDHSGKLIGQLGAAGNYGSVELSPKADRVALDMITNNNRDVWVMDIARAVPSRITYSPDSEWSPSWSPDGSRLLFTASRDGVNHMYEKASSGVGNDELVMPMSTGAEIATHWSPDGKSMVFSRLQPGKTPAVYDTWRWDTEAKKESPLLESPFSKYNARISPDSRFIAYSTNDSGIFQVFVQTFPDAKAGRWQITAQGGVEPKWSRNGRELYYLGFDGKLMAVPIKTERGFEAGTPVALFDIQLSVNRNQPSTDRRYDVAPDGRFLIAVPIGAGTAPQVIAMVNWPSKLKSN